MNVSVTEAKNKLTQLLTAVARGERVTIERHGQIIAEIVKPSAKRVPNFGTLKGAVRMTPEQFRILIATALAEDVSIIANDREFKKYKGLRLIW